MLTVIILCILTVILPLIILRHFSIGQKALVCTIVIGQVLLMLYLHDRLVKKTGFSIVRDGNVDAMKYYDDTVFFSQVRPFHVKLNKIQGTTRSKYHFGYQYVLAQLRTISSKPVLAIRILKILLFLTSLSCLTRAWVTDYGDRLGIWAFALMGILFHPAFYYSYRNFKDSIILSLFMFIMAILITLFRPKAIRLKPLTKQKVLLLWCLVVALLLALSTMRIYVSGLIIVAMGIHVLMPTGMDMKAKVSFSLLLLITGLAMLQSAFVTNIMEISKEHSVLGGLNPYVLFHSLVAPVPWQYTADPPLSFFHCLYLLSLPYALYCLFRHIQSNFNWQLFVYLMVIYIGGITGSEARKRIIIIPIMVSWMLFHTAYKRKKRNGYLYSTAETGMLESEYCVNEEKT